MLTLTIIFASLLFLLLLKVIGFFNKKVEKKGRPIFFFLSLAKSNFRGWKNLFRTAKKLYPVLTKKRPLLTIKMKRRFQNLDRTKPRRKKKE